MTLIAHARPSATINSGLRTSIDLILGLPNQTAGSFDATLEEAIGGGVGHVSVYMLDLDEDTALKRRVEAGVVTLPPEEMIADAYVAMVERLHSAGFSQYEISNFARCGEESTHNLRYWRREEYLGFGIGAHSFLGERRFANTRESRATSPAISRRSFRKISPRPSNATRPRFCSCDRRWA